MKDYRSMVIKQLNTKGSIKANVKLRLLFIIFTGTILVLAGYWLSSAYYTRKKIEAYAISNTGKDVELAATAIRLYVEEKNKLPFKPIEGEEFIVAAKPLYQTLFKSSYTAVEMVDPPPHWRSSENIVDRWNNQLNIIVKPKQIPDAGESVHHYIITIWSNGPNGINESGNGDDISYSFSVELWKETPAQPRPQKSK